MGDLIGQLCYSFGTSESDLEMKGARYFYLLMVQRFIWVTKSWCTRVHCTKEFVVNLTNTRFESVTRFLLKINFVLQFIFIFRCILITNLQ